MSLKELENRILASAQEESQKILSKANQEVAERLAAARAQEDQLLSELSKKLEREMVQGKLQARSLAVLNSREAILRAKQDFINQVGGALKEELGKMTEANYQKLLLKILKPLLPWSEEVEVILPKGKEEKTRKALEKSIGILGLKTKLKYLPQSKELLGGAIIRGQGVELNASFDEFLKDFLEQNRLLLAQLLFEEEK